MGLIGTSLLILGLIMSVIEQTTEQAPELSSTAPQMLVTTTKARVTVTSSPMGAMSIATTEPTVPTGPTVQGTTTVPVNEASSMSTPANSSNTNTASASTSPAKPPTRLPTRRTSTRQAKVSKPSATHKPKIEESNKTGVILIIVVILLAVVLGGICFFTRNRSRKYTVDLHSRQDDAEIPLSTVDPDEPVILPQNGMQTFDPLENDTKEPKDLEPEAKPQGQEEQKAEAGSSTDDPSSDPPGPTPSPDGSVDKAKDDITAPSPDDPAKQTPSEKTDDEGAVSNKTSEESLKEPSEN